MDLKNYVGKKISSFFGENTLHFPLLKEKLPPDVYEKLIRAVQFFEELTPDIADAVAAAIKEWALGKGATSYTHWFQPLTGLTAEKHDSFLSYGSGGGLIEDFTGAKLVKSEPGAPSLPHGGMRSTFEARGYAAWDPSSPAFIIDGEYGKTLFIPSVFVSYEGRVLDKKTPLIKSMKAVSEAALRLLRLLGHDNVQWVYPRVGPEQEYFLVDLHHLEQRPDLRILGYTLFGEKAPKGQQFQDHYLGAITERVLAFMQEMEIELYRLGIPAKTRHNEVAPNQFEITTLHENANIATDHNQLLMEVMRRVARRHGFAALLHEKPFSGINGSGKHNNWSMVDSNGRNMFNPGITRQDNLRFLCFVTAVLRGVHQYGDLLRAIIAGPGNDLRLGSHEAPPAIMSVFLGDELTRFFQELEEGELEIQKHPNHFNTGVAFIPRFPKDVTDCNRTSPFAFTGNKFEFRAVGSSASLGMPNTVINSMVTEGLHAIADLMEAKINQGADPAEAALNSIREIYAEAMNAHFEGDNYLTSWHKEATRRGLAIVLDAPSALEFLQTEKNISLFERFHILDREEVHARYQVNQTFYVNTVELELSIARSMIRTLFIPSCFQYQKELLEAVEKLAQCYGEKDAEVKTQKEYIHQISSRLKALVDQLGELDQCNAKLSQSGHADQARFCADTIRPAVTEARTIVDELEALIDNRCWRVPRYSEMLAIQ